MTCFSSMLILYVVYVTINKFSFLKKKKLSISLNFTFQAALYSSKSIKLCSNAKWWQKILSEMRAEGNSRM